ncbi:MAG: Hsp20/alpha crystallin family protein [Anaerolineales bacterium]|jgi:HSP20 family protein|nr:Hsp20/alpha crystallin family protein [Anaerolineales bacterium]
MEELELKSEPIQPIWYNDDESQTISGGKRWWNGVRFHIWRPPTDVFETDDAIIVRVEIAGMREDDFSISLTGPQLTVRGNRPDIQERRAYHQMEIFFGEFSTEVKLPGPVSADQVVAEYKAGFLRLVFPKDQPKKIRVTE